MFFLHRFGGILCSLKSRAIYEEMKAMGNEGWELDTGYNSHSLKDKNKGKALFLARVPFL